MTVSYSGICTAPGSRLHLLEFKLGEIGLESKSL